MSMHDFLMELEDIHCKYARMVSLIGILQQFVAEQVEIAGAPEDSLSNALYEIELEMDKTNERLKGLMKKGDAAE